MKLSKIPAYTLCLLCALGLGGTLLGMSNDEVVKMSSAGLSEETMILAIQHAEEAEFDTSAMALVALKEAGLSEAVIQAVIARADGPPAAEQQSAASQPAKTQSTFPDVPSEEVMPPECVPQVGNRYFTRINFWYEGDDAPSTNYSRGILVPVNTEVELLTLGKKDFTIQLKGGQSVKIENIPKYTGASVEELAARYLAEVPTKVELYGEETARMIRTGVLRLGMTKDQVVLTRGYPPIHETPSLESDRWIYWSSRFVKHTLLFSNGRLAEGRGLY